MEKMMPFDSEGNFTRMHNWEEDRQNDIDIMSDRMDEEDDNFAKGFNDTMLRDGRATMTGNTLIFLMKRNILKIEIGCFIFF